MKKERMTEMDKIKNIVGGGTFQGWAKSHIIINIMYEIATEEELERLSFWDDIPELKAKAEKLYDYVLMGE